MTLDYNLYLGKKDVEILLWKKSIPPRLFKYFLEQMILSKATDFVPYIPPITENRYDGQARRIHIIFTNEKVIEYLLSIPQENRSEEIKNILLEKIRDSNYSYFHNSKKQKKAKVIKQKNNLQEKTELTNNKPTENTKKTEQKSSDSTQSSNKSTKNNDLSSNSVSLSSTNQQNSEQKPKKKSQMLNALIDMAGE